MNIAGDIQELEPGDSWCIPMDALHQVEVLEDAVVVEVFSPTSRRVHQV